MEQVSKLDPSSPFYEAMQIIGPLPGEHEIDHLIRAVHLTSGQEDFDYYLEELSKTPELVIERARIVKSGKIPDKLK